MAIRTPHTPASHHDERVRFRALRSDPFIRLENGVNIITNASLQINVPSDGYQKDMFADANLWRCIGSGSFEKRSNGSNTFQFCPICIFREPTFFCPLTRASRFKWCAKPTHPRSHFEHDAKSPNRGRCAKKAGRVGTCMELYVAGGPLPLWRHHTFPIVLFYLLKTKQSALKGISIIHPVL